MLSDGRTNSLQISPPRRSPHTPLASPLRQGLCCGSERVLKGQLSTRGSGQGTAGCWFSRVMGGSWQRTPGCHHPLAAAEGPRCGAAHAAALWEPGCGHVTSEHDATLHWNTHSVLWRLLTCPMRLSICRPPTNPPEPIPSTSLLSPTWNKEPCECEPSNRLLSLGIVNNTCTRVVLCGAPDLQGWVFRRRPSTACAASAASGLPLVCAAAATSAGAEATCRSSHK